MAERSASRKISPPAGFRKLRLSPSATTDEINQAFKERLESLQRRYADRPDRLVEEADELYESYRSAFLSKEGANEEEMLPLTITGPDSLLNMFGITDVPHQSMKVQMHSQAQYKDGQLMKKESSKTESFINKDGKRETKVYENGKLVKHTIDGKNMLR